jgi:hypothetical protein
LFAPADLISSYLRANARAGIGLGLPVAKMLIANMSGTMQFATSPCERADVSTSPICPEEFPGMPKGTLVTIQVPVRLTDRPPPSDNVPFAAEREMLAIVAIPDEPVLRVRRECVIFIF